MYRQLQETKALRSFMKRKLDIVVISDIHLGTYGCHAKELLNYLKSIQPRTLILNGDIFDIWYFKKSYFPKDHLEVVRRLLRRGEAVGRDRVDRRPHRHHAERGVVALRNRARLRVCLSAVAHARDSNASAIAS